MYDAKAVVVDSRVYIGGGVTLRGEENRFLCYNSLNNEWKELARCPVSSYGLTLFQEHLIAVGGIAEEKLSDVLYEYENEWKQADIPHLLTARHSLVAVSHDDFLITCGGKGAEVCNIVEVYSSNSKTWFPSCPLPHPAYNLSCTVINEQLFILGGFSKMSQMNNKVFYTDLKSLTSPSSTWAKIPNIPLSRCTAANLGGCLAAIGGQKSNKTKIHVYSELVKNWLPYNSVLKRRDSFIAPAVAELETGELLLFGGANSHFEPQETAFRCCLKVDF